METILHKTQFEYGGMMSAGVTRCYTRISMEDENKNSQTITC